MSLLNFHRPNIFLMLFFAKNVGVHYGNKSMLLYIMMPHQNYSTPCTKPIEEIVYRAYIDKCNKSLQYSPIHLTIRILCLLYIHK